MTYRCFPAQSGAVRGEHKGTAESELRGAWGENQLKAIVIPLLPGIDQNVVVCVEENESGSSLLVEKVQQPQALEVGHQDDY